MCVCVCITILTICILACALLYYIYIILSSFYAFISLLYGHDLTRLISLENINYSRDKSVVRDETDNKDAHVMRIKNYRVLVNHNCKLWILMQECLRWGGGHDQRK